MIKKRINIIQFVGTNKIPTGHMLRSVQRHFLNLTTFQLHYSNSQGNTSHFAD